MISSNFSLFSSDFFRSSLSLIKLTSRKLIASMIRSKQSQQILSGRFLSFLSITIGQITVTRSATTWPFFRSNRSSEDSSLNCKQQSLHKLSREFSISNRSRRILEESWKRRRPSAVKSLSNQLRRQNKRSRPKLTAPSRRKREFRRRFLICAIIRKFYQWLVSCSTLIKLCSRRTIKLAAEVRLYWRKNVFLWLMSCFGCHSLFLVAILKVDLTRKQSRCWEERLDDWQEAKLLLECFLEIYLTKVNQHLLLMWMVTSGV